MKAAIDLIGLKISTYPSPHLLPKTDIFGAQIGHNPSYSWRSIRSAKNLVSEGCNGALGVGGAISVLEVFVCG